MILSVAAIVGNIALPPARFDHEPDGRVLVYQYTLAQIEQQCRDANLVACWYRLGDTCIVILPIVGPGGVSLNDRALLRRHEYGHCNGWTKEHEE